MDIRFIKKNMEKQSSNDMMNILKDLIIKSDISTINNYSNVKQYHKGDKVYIKEGKKHRVYICLVENATVGEIKSDEWKHYIEGDPNKNKLNAVDIYEERLTVDRNGLFDHPLDFPNFKNKNTFVAAFNSIQPRLRYGVDFIITENGIVKFLNPMNIGEKVILEIRHFNGKLFNNLFVEVYVEESFTALKKTRAVPIRYHGYRESSKLEVFNQDGTLLEEGIDYELDRAYIILNELLQANQTLHITMWNKVLIRPTSYDYVLDELNNLYRLGVNDMAQLTLTQTDEVAIGNPYIELISEDGTIYHCMPRSQGQLILVPAEPDIILASDNTTHKLSVNENGEIYLDPIESDYYKDIYLVSIDIELYKIISDENGDVDIEKVINNNLLLNTLNYKHVIGDDGRLYELTINNGVLSATPKDVDHSTQDPIKYLNLISPNGTNFMFFATDDAHLAVRPIYIIDDTSNIIIGDDGYLYLIGITNDGEIFTKQIRCAPYVAEHKKITDVDLNLYEVHVDEDGSLYILNMDSVTTEQIPMTLDSDSKDEYIGFINNEQYLVSYNTKKSTIVKDIKTGYEYALYVENNNISPVRVQTELLEKDYITLVSEHKVYMLYMDNGSVKLDDTGVLLPEKDDVKIVMTDQNGNNSYLISVVNGNINIE